MKYRARYIETLIYTLEIEADSEADARREAAARIDTIFEEPVTQDFNDARNNVVRLDSVKAGDE